MIPDFESATGNLPPGIHEASWVELAQRFGATPQRRRLLDVLLSAIGVLASFGCKNIWVDGSFVTSKDDPADYDACWDMTGVDWRAVERAEPCIFELNGDRAGQKERFGGALWPAHITPDETPGRTMLENFQWDRQGRRKGIVLLRLPLDDTLIDSESDLGAREDQFRDTTRTRSSSMITSEVSRSILGASS